MLQRMSIHSIHMNVRIERRFTGNVYVFKGLTINWIDVHQTVSSTTRLSCTRHVRLTNPLHTKSSNLLHKLFIFRSYCLRILQYWNGVVDTTSWFGNLLVGPILQPIADSLFNYRTACQNFCRCHSS